MGLQAMYSAISGLQSDSGWLDVVGNNISNTSTVAYKASRVEFADQFSRTLSGGFADYPARNEGGVDPRQVGTGTRIAIIAPIFTQGPTLQTGVSTDISIQGDGFLVAKQGNQTYLTRAGNLNFDSQGFLVDQNGARIQGFNAGLQYVHTVINSAANGGFAQITNADLNLDTTNVSGLQDIRINSRMSLPPKATTEVTFRGNLDALQQPNVLDLFPGGFFGGPSLPIGLTIAAVGLPAAIDTNRMTIQFTATGGFTLQQVGNLSTFTPGVNPPPAPLENGFVNLAFVKAFAGSYVWDKQPPVPPAQQLSETVYDSNGNPRQITLQFYQVNDLGTNGINNPGGPNQACYAWYAFDTTGGKTISTANLLGGTGIGEGDFSSAVNPFFSYDRGLPGQNFFGDFLWFNTDGSLASSGGVGGVQGPPGLDANYMTVPRIYLPPENYNPPQSPIPTQGAEITPISLDFGTFGLLGGGVTPPFGKRDGLTGDANGTYQVVNGVNTYVPQNTVYAASQDGYQEGSLQGLNFDQSGVIQGTFSNGQTVDLAQVALDRVQNPEGLSKIGDNGFGLSPNVGPVQTGLAGQGGFGKIQGGSLEGSNVDLTVELTDMILAQRGFASNARVVSSVNENLNILANLGR